MTAFFGFHYMLSPHHFPSENTQVVLLARSLFMFTKHPESIRKDSKVASYRPQCFTSLVLGWVVHFGNTIRDLIGMGPFE